jgi:general secretion pathway protein G
MLNLTAGRAATIPCGAGAKRRRLSAGFTLVELLITMMIFMIICAMAVPSLMSAIKAAKIGRAVADVRTIGMAAYGFYATTGNAPATLTDIGYNQQIDGWGHKYQYLPFPAGTIPANARVDRFGVPINTYFDVYSLGADGQTSVAISDAEGQDDVIWAYDGSYKGLAANIDEPSPF